MFFAVARVGTWGCLEEGEFIQSITAFEFAIKQTYTSKNLNKKSQFVQLWTLNIIK